MLYIPIENKLCPQCGDIFPYSGFHKRRRAADGLGDMCKQCAISKQDRYRKDHPEQEKARAAEYNKKHKEWHNAICRKSYNKRVDAERERTTRYRKQNPEKRKEVQHNYNRSLKGKISGIKYRKSHPEQASIRDHARRSKIAAIPFRFTARDWNQCLSYWGNKCAICGRTADFWHTIARDHWIPVAANFPLSATNPGTVPTNILPLCHSIKGGEDGCNNLKSNQNPIEWLTTRFGPRKAKKILAKIEAYFSWVHEQDSHK